MQQIPSSDANNHSTSQEISCFLWNPLAHSLVHTIPPLVPTLKHMHPVNTFLMLCNIS
jgi:hypothetical protein